MKNKKDTHLHFVGIGGIGMSGIAEVFLNQGFRVSGSDQFESESVKRLRALGAVIALEHKAENVRDADVVVISSAIRPTNPEVLEAKRMRIPVIPRAEMLGELMRGKTGIAVAGSHGKTSTTSMLATVLTYAGLDPTLVIGGKVDALGGNAHLGKGEYVVAEADESDGSFLHLPASFSIITNIDNDHMDFFGTQQAIEDAFVNFVGKIPFYGVAAVCIDDVGVRKALTRFTKPYLTFGTTEDADYQAVDIRAVAMGSEFDVRTREGAKLGRVELAVPGRHNVLNALAAIVISLRLGLSFEKIRAGLKSYGGVKRRFEVRWKDSSRVIIDDYGHHPTEIVATLAAARSCWNGRIVTVFQPHRYSRTLHCREGFLTAFKESDVVLITDIYAAGEDPIPGIDSVTLVKQIRDLAAGTQQVIHVGDLAAAKRAVLDQFIDGDMVLCMGAGSITKLAEELKSELTS